MIYYQKSKIIPQSARGGVKKIPRTHDKETAPKWHNREKEGKG